MNRAALCLLLMVAAPVWAQTNDIVLPPLPSPPTPPQPPPTTTQQLLAGQMYVARGQKDFLLTTSPTGLVNIMKVKGPLTVYGVFVGGSGQPETKVFSEPVIYIVTAAKQGMCELLVFPQGAADEKDVIRRQLDVGGVGPGPGPGPTDPLLDKLKTSWAKETVADKARAGDVAAHYHKAATMANDTKYATMGAYFADVVKDGGNLGAALAATRDIIGGELNGYLPPSPTAPMDAKTRAICQAQFERMAGLVETLAKGK